MHWLCLYCVSLERRHRKVFILAVSTCSASQLCSLALLCVCVREFLNKKTPGKPFPGRGRKPGQLCSTLFWFFLWILVFSSLFIFFCAFRLCLRWLVLGSQVATAHKAAIVAHSNAAKAYTEDVAAHIVTVIVHTVTTTSHIATMQPTWWVRSLQRSYIIPQVGNSTPHRGWNIPHSWCGIPHAPFPFCSDCPWKRLSLF